jgi:hypothetical protein
MTSRVMTRPGLFCLTGDLRRRPGHAIAASKGAAAPVATQNQVAASWFESGRRHQSDFADFIDGLGDRTHAATALKFVEW